MSDAGYAKDVSGFARIGGALEPPFEKQSGYWTRNEDFFVCSAEPTPRIDPADWRLELTGDGLAGAASLGYDELCAMPQRTVACVVECAGNHRTLFETVLGEDLSRRRDVTITRWRLGGVGMASWRGVPLAEVLARAGLVHGAAHVMPVGLDPGEEEDGAGVRVPLPLDKALHPDTLVALEMNGAPLPPDHGFPARLVVPGWVGTYSIKWLGRIEVTRERPRVPRNTTMYVMMGPQWPQERYAPAMGAPVTQHPIRSSLALPLPARLAPGRHRLAGYARGGEFPVTRVAWSADRGATWRDAELLSTPARWAWTRFAFEWDATPGDHVLMTRATDASGATQPMEIPFNLGGYLFDMVHPHEVAVEG